MGLFPVCSISASMLSTHFVIFDLLICSKNVSYKKIIKSCYKNNIIVFHQYTVLFLKVGNNCIFHLVKIATIKLNIYDNKYVAVFNL